MNVFFFKQKTAYDMRISDWSSDVCSSDLETLVVCVGQADGAQVGQVLDVIRNKRRIRHSRAGGPRYRRENVGQVRIAELLDSHYAEAEVISGSPKVNDTVELIRP